MSCAPRPSDLRSESAHFDEARPLTWFVYKVARNFFKPSNFVKLTDRLKTHQPLVLADERASERAADGRPSPDRNVRLDGG